jgi:hypothetical protein
MWLPRSQIGLTVALALFIVALYLADGRFAHS